ncbi:MAG: glycoside hydrolase family 25 protein [Eubacterium sp.]|nr:glycoside hydrolase family 25 protein [Eubacterium sp.]
MKRKIILVLCTAAILSVLASCGNKESKENASAAASADTAAVSEASQDLPAPDTSVVSETGSGSDDIEDETAGEGTVPEMSTESVLPEDSPEESPEEAFRMPETLGDMKAMDAAALYAAATKDPELMAWFMDERVPKNTYQNISFRHEDGRVYYEEEGFTSILGIDVSSHQGEIDWEAVKASGIDFVIIRAGFRGYGESGSLNEDAMFRQNLAGAKAAGLKVGAYFFSQALTEEEAYEEADFLLQILDGEPLDLPLVFDEEHIRGDEARTDAMALSQATANALAFCERVSTAGYTPMVYTNLLWEGLVYDMASLTEYPVWYAGYDPVPLTPYLFEYWQYSESGTVPGIDGKVDLDIRIIHG